MSTLEEKFIFDVIVEMQRARAKFPSNEYKLAALTEEVGEVANAFLENAYGKKGAVAVWEECVQVASCALRLATEGDASFPYDSNQLRLEF